MAGRYVADGKGGGLGSEKRRDAVNRFGAGSYIDIIVSGLV